MTFSTVLSVTLDWRGEITVNCDNMQIASKVFTLLRVAAIFAFLVYDATTQPMTYETDSFIVSQNALQFYEQKYDHEGLRE